jgi:putative hydrolase of the HAD superfamily
MSAVLLIDLAGVLFRFDHERRLRVLAECLRLPAQRVDQLLWESGFSHDCDVGRYPNAAAARAEIRRRTAYRGSDSALDRAWCSAYEPDPAVLDIVRAARLPRGIFTNNGPLEEDTLPGLYPDAFEPFGHRFFAWRLDANKPDARAYEHVTELLGVAPGDVAFIDDSPDNVDGARTFGWDAVLFEQPSDLLELIARSEGDAGW